MKITNQNSTSASGAASAEEVQRSRSAGSSGNGKSGATGDSVELSSTLGSLSRAMESYSSSRNSQVQALAAQYRSGTYNVDPAATSRGMVSEALGG
jgi:anti-sigma28 factor (negative regulator of flagellin synthesis)